MKKSLRKPSKQVFGKVSLYTTENSGSGSCTNVGSGTCSNTGSGSCTGKPAGS
jgi:hypothetical protein